MLHEWLHMDWGKAEICPGGGKLNVALAIISIINMILAFDHYMRIGPDHEKVKIYKGEPAKMLANSDVHAAAKNSEC